jgi:hypothetical protein
VPAPTLPALGLAALLSGPAGSLSLDRDWLRDLPASHDVWSLVETVDPFCIVDRIDSGGLYAAEPGRIGCHGSSWTQASFELDGLDVTDPDRGGTPLLAPELLVLEGVSVLRDRAPATRDGAGAGFALATSAPATSWSGSLLADATASQAQPSDGPPPIARYGHGRHLAALARGPLAGERLSLLASASVSDSERVTPEAAVLDGRLRSLLLGLGARPAPLQEARLLLALQHARRPFAGRALFAARAGEEADRRAHAQGLWRRASGARVVELAAGYTRASLEPELSGRPDGVVERLLDGPVAELAPERSLRERWEVRGGWDASLGWLGAGPHQLAVRASLTGAAVTARPAAPLGLVGETVDGLPARIWEYGLAGPRSRRRSTALAFAVMDRIAPTRRLQLAAGLRFVALDASAEGGGRLDWQALDPRLEARWRAMQSPAADLYGSYARYRQRVPLRALAFGDPGGPAGATYLWDDADGDGRAQASERGALVSRLGPGGPVATIDPDLRSSWTEEVALGLELAPGEDWRLRFQAIHRQERDLLESLNVGVPPESYEARGVLDPYVDFVGASDDRLLLIYDRDPASFGLDRYLLTNPSGHTMLHEGFELSAEKTRGRLRLLLGAAAYRSEARSGWRGFRVGENDQGLIGELFDDPNADSYARGRLFFDRNYVVKLAGRYEAPHGVRLAAVARYQDGQPFARVVVAEDLRQGADFVHAVPEGRHRFTYTLTVDAHLEKGFGLGRSRLGVFAEAFNLLDTGHSVEEDVTTAPAFRERLTRFRQPPRAVRLGLRLDF